MSSAPWSMPRLSRAVRTVCAAMLGTLLTSCGLFGTDPSNGPTSVFCVFEAASGTIAASTIDVGQTTTATVTITISPGCAALASIYTVSAVSADPSIAQVGAGAVTTLDHSDEFNGTLIATVPVSGVAPGGPINISITVRHASQPERTVTVPVSVRAPQAASGTLNVQIAGLSGGTSGNVRITGPNGFSQTVTSTQQLTVPPGTYTVTTNTVETTNADFADPAPPRTVQVTAGQTTSVTTTYEVIARLVNFTTTGLTNGVNPLIVLTQGALVVQVATAIMSQKLAVGTWNAEVREVSGSGRTFRTTLAAAQVIAVTANISPLAVQFAYYMARWQFALAATMGVNVDCCGHAGFILMWASNALTILREWAPPPTGGLSAQQTGTETVTISGPAPFVTVTGTRQSNGTLTLTGSATVAGWPNTPVTLTGTLTDLNVLTAQYQMGQSTAPTGLPGGAITYNLTGQ